MTTTPPPEQTNIVPASQRPQVAPGEEPAASTSTASSSTASTSTSADPRDRVTPEAFFVAPHLLGKPLAAPVARGWAWVIDGALVGMLSQASSFLLAIALAVLSYQLISKRKLALNADGSGNNTRAGKLPILMTALFVGWAAMIGFDWLFNDDRPAKADAAEAVAAAAPGDAKLDAIADLAASAPLPMEAELKALRAENAELKAERDAFSLIETGRQLLDDIGFGFGWAAVYFSLLPAWWQGQTLGKRVLGLRVLKLNGKPLTVWDSFNRYGGYAAGFATGLLGFAQVFWDANRQAIHDQISFTVVVDERRS